MVSITDIEENINQRFLSKNEFEKIKINFERMPFSKKFIIKNNILYATINEKEQPICEILYPGLDDFFLSLKDNFEKLIKHIEEADTENDLLLERLRYKP